MLHPLRGETLGPEPLSSHVFSGMELFEEALQKWEQALSVGQRGDGGSTPTPGDSFQNPDTSSEAPSEVGGLPQSLQEGWEGRTDGLQYDLSHRHSLASCP